MIVTETGNLSAMDCGLKIRFEGTYPLDYLSYYEVGVLFDMHIAIVSGEYPPRWEALARWFSPCRHFVQLGHEVTIITRSP